MASLMRTTRTGGHGIRKAVMDALLIRPIKLSETYSNGFRRRHEQVQNTMVKNTQLDLDRTRQGRRYAGGLRQGYRRRKWISVIGCTIYTCVYIPVVL
jgi:hypothetical protein